MTKNELIQAVAQSAGLSNGTVAQVLDHLLRTVRDEMGQGQSINLSPLGAFKVDQLPAREGRNPRTGAVIQVAARKSVKFKPSSSLRERLKEE